MKILLTEKPEANGYIESLMGAYINLGHQVSCDVHNFFFSNWIPDVLHIHWPERLYKWYCPVSLDEVDIYELIKERLDWYKKNSVSIVYTVHNLTPHEKGLQLDDRIFRLIIKYANILVHHCNKSVVLFEDMYRELLHSEQKNIVCHHGDYLIHYKNVNRELARARYNIPEDKVVTINLGRQRPYKNENFILDVFDRVDSQSKHLVIAGEFNYHRDNFFEKWHLKFRNKIRENFTLQNRTYIYKSFPVPELPYIMACADIAFIAQTSALNSGFIALAATYSLPVVIPDIGCLKESVDDWAYKTYTANDKDGAVSALNAMYAEFESVERCNNLKWLENNSWTQHADKIINSVKECQLMNT